MAAPTLVEMRPFGVHRGDGRALFWRLLSTGEEDLVHRQLDQLSEQERQLIEDSVPARERIALADNRGWLALEQAAEAVVLVVGIDDPERPGETITQPLLVRPEAEAGLELLAVRL